MEAVVTPRIIVRGIARVRGSRRPWRRTAALVGIALFVTQTAACYTYEPVYTGTPSAGDRMAFVITDQGRVALSDQVGPGITRVMGRVTSTQGDDYVVAVDEIESIAHGTSHWTGERITLRKDYVAGVQTRTLDRGRTTVAAAVAAGALAALIAVASLTGFGFGGGSGSGSGNPNGS